MVRLGEYDFNEESDEEIDFQVSNIFQHEDYERKTYTNDIAMLKLDSEVEFSDYKWPICLPFDQDISEGDVASVTGLFWQHPNLLRNVDNSSQLNHMLFGAYLRCSGWGTTSYSGSTSDVLLEVQLPVWNQDECVSAFTQPITEKQLCAGYKEGGKDSCQVKEQTDESSLIV